MTREEIIARLRENEAALRQQGVAHAALFGSRARGEENPESDTDIMIDIDPAAPVGIYEYVRIKEYIGSLFDGHVDVVDRAGLKPYVRPAAIADAVYAMPSKSEDARRWLNDIHHHIQMATGFISGIGFDAFRDDMLRLYAVTRRLEIISEASPRLPDDLKARHPSLEWREMAAAGNIYRHEYEDVAAQRVWRTLTVSLPPLLEVIESELKALDARTG